jgi:mannose-6-phosphate isomerase-like protein (cupin superfamily)
MIDLGAVTESVYGGDVVRSLLFASADSPQSRVVRVAVASTEPGKGGQLHHHPKTDETYYVISGRAEIELDGQLHRLTAPCCIRIPRGTDHRITNVGDSTLHYLAFHVADAEFGGAVEHVKAV